MPDADRVRLGRRQRAALTGPDQQQTWLTGRTIDFWRSFREPGLRSPHTWLRRSAGSWLPGCVFRDSALSARQVCTAFGLTTGSEASITAVARGAAGRVWCLDLGTERFAVKELFSPPDEGSVRREAAFTAHLERAGVRLAASVPGQADRFVVPVPGQAADRRLRLYRWIDGVLPDLADPGMAARIGDLLGRLHAHAPPAQVPAGDPWYDTVPALESWGHLTGAARTQSAGWAGALSARISLLADLADLVTPAPASGLITCHRDLHPDNVLAESSGALIPLDWDEAGPAIPDRELAAVLMFWHLSDQGEADSASVRRTLAAYLAAGGPGRIRDEQTFGMYLATRLNFLHRQASIALDPRTSPEHRGYAALEIADTLARLPALPLIRHLITLAAPDTG